MPTEEGLRHGDVDLIRGTRQRVMQILENNRLRITIAAHGAELTSVLDKTHGLERLWSGNAAIWNRHAPLLFPIVGRLLDNTYAYQGQSYILPQHGFARDSTFTLRRKAVNAVSCRLTDSPKTRASFPFAFSLEVDYTLQDEKLRVAHTVSNPASSPLYFSIGGHPGFACPLLPGEKFSDYYIEFEKKETCARWYANENGHIHKAEENYLKDTQMVPYTLDRFSEDALVFKDLESKQVSIKCFKNDHAVTMDFSGWPYLGIWSKPGGAPFICLEPWYGIADHVGHNGVLVTKEGIIALEPGESFCCEYGMTFS
jgi:galactose mutarotase-like enzyme